ncbi:MAG: tetratricopeptide repeat protein [Muribaculaceae bacterium]|nr:tetratricopeptide repeat protein [Muribaculaceae bacterium]
MQRIKYVLMCLLVLLASMPAQAVEKSVKKERNHIRAGNALFHAKRYAEAEVEYNKALEVAPTSEAAKFNLATALLMQGGNAAGDDEKDKENNPVNRAVKLLQDLSEHATQKSMRSKAHYDLGNISYASQQYQQAVDCYKKALRLDPSDDQARYNLRMAQLKLRDQQNQNKNQNQDKNQNKDKNKDQDKNNQDKQNQQDKKQQNNQEQNQQQQQGGMSQQNVEQVLQTMQNQENATQQRVNMEQAKQKQRERARTNRRW